ncbi:hypothetical protein RS130_12870 [Paraglaciecola aquimarina]|uniref:Small integral membrane protein n=1 Tax=Paraglaciecola aquimarina TaxID=1235557 RepID=A0ABU3SXE7_9ALTE|nr:hypothetical protein [Paraglaciecola aquimarina]MDU0354691.1 hypothetical protein [Paraglaciecola aquimarina]
MAENKLGQTLFNQDFLGDSKLYQASVLEQYKLFIASAENISNRRQTANAFFVTINTALVSFHSYFSSMQTSIEFKFWLVSITGIIISYMWFRLVTSYKDLNSAKFAVIQEIEAKLPLNPYKAEWERLKSTNAAKPYRPFTQIEAWLPWVFIFIHLAVLSMSFYGKLFAQ